MVNGFLLVLLWGMIAAQEPDVIYLTWIKDPATTMTIQWHTAAGRGPTQVVYHPEENLSWVSVEGKSTQVSGTQVDMHIVHLEGLKEDGLVVFKIGEGPTEYRFRTLPKTLKRPVRLAVGGDIFYPGKMELFRKMNRVVASQDPDVVVLGGDLAYTTNRKKNLFKGLKWKMARWQTFLRELHQMRGKDGRLIPLLPVVGNHDVDEKAKLFYDLFAFPEAGKAYRMFDAGNYLSLALLDTGHSHPVGGEQTTWLEKNLRERQNTPYLWCAYHVAAYPSYYPYEGEVSQQIRTNWVPLFEKYGVKWAFEHHNHRFKRSYPIKEGKVDPQGVIYLGDGSWGVPPRPAVDPDKRWYLERSESINACYFVTLSQESCKVEARNLEGVLID